jgi:hypothetical protein
MNNESAPYQRATSYYVRVALFYYLYTKEKSLLISRISPKRSITKSACPNQENSIQYGAIFVSALKEEEPAG